MGLSFFNGLFTGSNWSRTFFCFIALWLISACKLSVKKPDHPDLTKPIITRAGELVGYDPIKAVVYFQTAFPIVREPGPGDLFQKYFFLNKCYLWYIKDYPKALCYADTLISVMEPYADDREYNLMYATANVCKGDVLFKQKRFNEAYSYFYKGKMSAKEGDDRCAYNKFQYDFQNKLADVSYGQERYLEAAAWHKRAIALLDECAGDTVYRYSEQGVLDNIALAYSHAGLTDSALVYYGKALDMIAAMPQKTLRQKRDVDAARGVVYGNQGSTYYDQGKVELAEQKFKESIAINEQKGYAREDAMITRMKLAQLYMNTGRVAEASAQLQMIKQGADTFTDPKRQMELLHAEADLEEANGNKQQAWAYLNEYINRKNDYEAANKKLMGTDFINQFELLQQKIDLKEAEKQNQIKTFYLIAAVLGCIMAMVILYMALKSRKEAKAHVKQSVQQNQKLELTLGALEKSNQEYVHLLQVVAHDLKNPINAIYGISNLMVEEPGRSAEDLEMLEMIQVSSKNMNILIHDLLSARINVEHDELQKEPVSIKRLLEESVTLMQFIADEKKQRIELVNGDDEAIFAVRSRIWRVINNLVINAIKFSPANSLIQAGWAISGNDVVISIKDEGIGIPDELKENIFQPLTTSKRQGTDGEQAYGLGLFISRQIIEEHGGRIWLESKVGVGTTFYIALPLSRA